MGELEALQALVKVLLWQRQALDAVLLRLAVLERLARHGEHRFLGVAADELDVALAEVALLEVARDARSGDLACAVRATTDAPSSALVERLDPQAAARLAEATDTLRQSVSEAGRRRRELQVLLGEVAGWTGLRRNRWNRGRSARGPVGA